MWGEIDLPGPQFLPGSRNRLGCKKSVGVIFEVEVSDVSESFSRRGMNGYHLIASIPEFQFKT